MFDPEQRTHLTTLSFTAVKVTSNTNDGQLTIYLFTNTDEMAK